MDDEDEELTDDDETEDLDVTGFEDSSADLEIVSFVTPKKLKVGDYLVFVKRKNLKAIANLEVSGSG